MDQEELFLEFSEEKFGLDINFEATEFGSKTAIYRGVIDYARVYLSRGKLAQTGNLTLSAAKIEVTDWKTGKSKANPRQLETYALYFSELFDVEKILLREVYLSLEKAREWAVTKVDLEEVKKWIIEQAHTISVNQEWPAKPTPLCGYCPFQEICPAHEKLEEKSSLAILGL